MTGPLTAKVGALTQYAGQSEQLYRPSTAYNDTSPCKLATVSSIGLTKLVMELRHRAIVEYHTNAKKIEHTIFDHSIPLSCKIPHVENSNAG